MTLAVILEEARKVEKDDIIELVTSFLPAPGIDYMKSHGYLAWSVKHDDGIIKSYFIKQ
jgi:hypothetical protein